MENKEVKKNWLSDWHNWAYALIVLLIIILVYLKVTGGII